MTTSSDPGAQPALGDLEEEFGWICWRADDQCYARRPDTPAHDHDARGEDPADLREAVILALQADRDTLASDSYLHHAATAQNLQSTS
jgi:hypothetical protein